MERLVFDGWLLKDKLHLYRRLADLTVDVVRDESPA
jgi:hypothetical protein